MNRKFHYYLVRSLKKNTSTNNGNHTKYENNSIDALDHIHRIHTNINEMIRFAEAKNGALLTINFLILYTVFPGTIVLESQLLTVINCTSIGCLVASILILLITFIPKLHAQKEFNPVYFGTIAKINRKDYVNEMYGLKFNELFNSYSEQIHINSQIAKGKFVCFKIAVMLTIVSFFGSIITIYIR